MEREEIKRIFRESSNGFGWRDLLYKALNCNPKQADKWIEGCINSLYYKPNEYVLALKGGAAITDLVMQYIIPNDISIRSNVKVYPELPSVNIHTNFFVQCDLEWSHSAQKKLMLSVMEHNPKFLNGHMSKRLANYIAIDERWSYLKHSRAIVVDCDNADLELLRQINPLSLWGEAFAIYGRE